MDSINIVHARFSCPGQKSQHTLETGPDAVIFIDRKPCMGWSWINNSGDLVVPWEVLLKLKYIPEEVQENLTAAVRRGVVFGDSWMCIKLPVDKINEKPSDTLLSEIVKGMYMGELVKYGLVKEEGAVEGKKSHADEKASDIDNPDNSQFKEVSEVNNTQVKELSEVVDPKR
jgi:hypothetical protein